jgi:gas vesicle protein
MEASGKLIESINSDISELNKFIQDSTRSNVRTQLEEIRNVMTRQLNDEQKRLERLKSEQTENKETKKVSTEPTYVTITKYAFENNKDNVK